MSNHHTQTIQPESDTSGSNVPVLSAARFVQSNGWSVALVEELMDCGALPTLVVGKHRLINIEALRQRAQLESTLVPAKVVKASKSHVDSRTEKPMLLSIDGAAQCLELAPKTIRKWLSNGTCPFPTVLIGARRLVRRTDLEKFIDQLGGVPSEKPPAEISYDQNVKRGRGRPRNKLTPIH